MKDQRDRRLATSDLPEIVRKIRARTPARLLAGRAGAAYRTTTQLDLREAHATARDAVRAELNAERAFGKDFVNTWNLFEVSTNAVHKDEYLLRPELGRHFDGRSREKCKDAAPPGDDLQIAIDSLSVSAVAAQVPLLLPLIIAGAGQWHWKIGQTFVIHHCRVGILNEIGELFESPRRVASNRRAPWPSYCGKLVRLPRVPAQQCTHRRRPQRSFQYPPQGLRVPTKPPLAILSLAARMMETNSSGYQLKEAPPALGHP